MHSKSVCGCAWKYPIAGKVTAAGNFGDSREPTPGKKGLTVAAVLLVLALPAVGCFPSRGKGGAPQGHLEKGTKPASITGWPLLPTVPKSTQAPKIDSPDPVSGVDKSDRG